MRQADFGPLNIFHSSRESCPQTSHSNKLRHICQNRPSMHAVTIHAIIAQVYIKASAKTSLTHSDPKGGGGEIQSTSGLPCATHSQLFYFSSDNHNHHYPASTIEASLHNPQPLTSSNLSTSAKMADNIYDEIEIEVCAFPPPILPLALPPSSPSLPSPAHLPQQNVPY